MTREKLDFQMQARQYSDRLTDIPMPEVMQRLGYEGERQGEALVYRGDRGEVAMIIRQQKAFDHDQKLICKNSLDLVVCMRWHNEGVESFTHDHALEFLRTRSLVHERGDDPWRGPQGRAEDRDRGSHDRGGAPERGGYDFEAVGEGRAQAGQPLPACAVPRLYTPDFLETLGAFFPM